MRANRLFKWSRGALLLRLITPSLILSSSLSFGNNYTATGTGSAFCHDGTTNNNFPLAGARVELMDSDCDGSTICDEVMGQSHVAADGSFTVTGSGGDPGNYSWSRPDVYIRVVFNDDNGVRLTDELGRDQYFDTPEHDHDNTTDGSIIDFGSWTTGEHVSLGDGTKCAVWKKAHDAYNDAIKILGATAPAGHYDVEYWSAIYAGTPWTNTDTTHWPIHFPTVASVHEFAHSIRHAADGDANHFNWDVTRFRYARNHDICDPNSNRIGTDTHTMGLAFGFNEGWAEFWEGQTHGCWAISIDDELEGNNAFGLNVLSNAPFGGKKRMVGTLIKHPGAIHSLDEFVTFYAQETAQTRETLTRLMATVPKPPVSPAKMAEFAPQSLEKQRQLVESEISLLSTTERAASKMPLPPKGRCGGRDCEVVFKAAVAPAIAATEKRLRELEVSRLRASLETENENTMLAREQKGTLSQYLANLRSHDREERLAILQKGFSDAIETASRLQRHSPEIRVLIADMQQKLIRLRANRQEVSPLPLGLAGRVPLPEDTPVPGTK